MVGEIRDKETAEIAIHASLTGHLVLSTIHTNDAAGAITRLVDMGDRAVPRRVVADGGAGAAPGAPLCPECREAYTPTDEDAELGIDPGDFASGVARRVKFKGVAAGPPDFMLYRAREGLRACLGTGYRGRPGSTSC